MVVDDAATAFLGISPYVSEPADLQALWALGFDGATGRAVTAWHDGQARSRAADQAMSPA